MSSFALSWQTVVTRIALACAACWQGACGGGTDKPPPPNCVPAYSMSATPLATERYLRDLYKTYCDRGYGDCADLHLCAEYGSAEECRQDVPNLPLPLVPSSYHYDAESGAAFLNFVAGTECASFDIPSLELRLAPYQYRTPLTRVPPETTDCTQLELPAQYSGRLEETDAMFDGRHVDLYCFCASAGQRLEIRPASGTYPQVRHETYLFGPEGFIPPPDMDVVTVSTTGPHLLLVTGRLHDVYGENSCLLKPTPLTFHEWFEDYHLTVDVR